MENVESTFQSNIVAYIGLTKAALPHMKHGDCIINTTSVTAYKGSAGMLDYVRLPSLFLRLVRVVRD